MLLEKNRLNRRLFNDVFNQGQFFGGEYFSGKVANLVGQTNPRFAVVTQKKHLKSAVGRNRLRRRVYGALFGLLPQTKPGFGIILFVKLKVLSMEFIQIETSLTDLLKHLQIYND